MKDIAQFSLWLALISIVISTILHFIRSFNVKTRLNLERSGNIAYYLFVTAISIASVLLMYFIMNHDYRFEYIIRYSSSDLPLKYLISSFWAGQEGSFLLWTFLGAWLGLYFYVRTKYDLSRIGFFYNLQLMFLCILLIKQSPFKVVPEPFLDGFGLNMLLQDPWMVIHPPIVFLGYAAFAIPFAIAMASLWEREYSRWVERGMKWVLFSFTSLGAGIILGGVWSYKVLGWGGYWGWDPVENASLLPWLMSIALIHGLVIQRKKKQFIKTNYYLVSISFLLIIYSTFLTRSGILADFSVHSFVDLGITGWLLIFMGVTFIISVLLISIRSGDMNKLSNQHVEDPSFFSREFGVIAAVILLSLSAIATGLGTSAPLLTRILENPSSAPTSFYSLVNFPIAILIALFLAYIPLLRWGKNKTSQIVPYLFIGVVSGIVFDLLLLFLDGPEYSLFMRFMIAVLVFFSGFAIAINSILVVQYIKKRSMQVGGSLVHLGVVVMFFAIIVSTYFDKSRHVELPMGEGVNVFDYKMKFIAPEFEELKKGTRLHLRTEVERGSTRFEALPDIYVEDMNNDQSQRFHRPHIERGLLYDLYISPEGYETPQDRRIMENTYFMQKGDSITVDGFKIVFENFDLTRMAVDETRQDIKVGAILVVSTLDKKSFTITPYYQVGAENNSDRRVKLPGDGSKYIFLNGINATTKSIELFYDDQSNVAEDNQKNASMYAEISIKPAMTLLWFGVIILCVGAVVSIRRYK